MDNKTLYTQKKLAQLDKWQAEVDVLKAKASIASADTQIQINQKINALEARIEEGQDKLAELSHASEDAYESIKEGVESAWETIKDAMHEAANKFKK